MNILKQGGALLLAGVNVALLVWALRAYRQKRAMPDGYYQWLLVSPAVVAVELAVGLFFVAEGRQPHTMHMLYGVLVSLGAIAQLVLGRRTALGQKYRARPLVHAFVALLIALLTARSWMSA